MHQILVRQKNRASSKSPKNPIKVTSDRKPGSPHIFRRLK
ncbi:hypothetical protein CASFOL_014480 [Castilleja foliolosa]|uniref:Ribosomal protein L2 n=1 Tax=Castilleja foliolosa TaxID=1961234 RepID=A0ABD3DMY8_9LAMI